ncbi:MAG: ribosome-associated translation inhibitor RaiA [Bacteroidaceae bacterium]|nr:ribosome-associated translation inhibitor RaiA [Bacteroidaceae bacterium]
MDIKIQSIHFDATEKLQSFIEKKLEKVGKACDDARKAEVVLKVLKPETAKNKQTSIKLPLKGTELFVEKICDTFEEGVDLCVDSLLRQVEKYKEKQKGK